MGRNEELLSAVTLHRGLQHVVLLHQVQRNVQNDVQGEEDGFRLVLMYQRELVNLYRCVYDFM